MAESQFPSLENLFLPQSFFYQAAAGETGRCLLMAADQ